MVNRLLNQHTTTAPMKYQISGNKSLKNSFHGNGISLTITFGVLPSCSLDCPSHNTFFLFCSPTNPITTVPKTVKFEEKDRELTFGTRESNLTVFLNATGPLSNGLLCTPCQRMLHCLKNLCKLTRQYIKQCRSI